MTFLRPNAIRQLTTTQRSQNSSQQTGGSNDLHHTIVYAKIFLEEGIAPEITPVSKPNNSPPMAATIAIT